MYAETQNVGTRERFVKKILLDWNNLPIDLIQKPQSVCVWWKRRNCSYIAFRAVKMRLLSYHVSRYLFLFLLFKSIKASEDCRRHTIKTNKLKFDNYYLTFPFKGLVTVPMDLFLSNNRKHRLVQEKNIFRGVFFWNCGHLLSDW